MEFKIVKAKSEIKEVGLYRIIDDEQFFWGNYRAYMNSLGDFVIHGCDGCGRIF